MPPKKEELFQNLLDHPDDIGKVIYTVRRLDTVSQAILRPFEEPQPIGISATFSPSGTLIALALVTKVLRGSTQAVGNWGCLVVEFDDIRKNSSANRTSAGSEDGTNLLQAILTRAVSEIYAFDIAPIALFLFADHNLRLANGIDIQSAFPQVKDRQPLSIIRNVVDDQFRIFNDNIKHVFRSYTSPKTEAPNRHNDLIQRAWMARVLTDLDSATDTFAKVKAVDLTKFPDATLLFLVKRERDSLLLEQQQPTSMRHRFRNGIDASGKHLAVASEYKTKFQRAQDIEVTVVSEHGGMFTLLGATGNVDGRSTELATTEQLSNFQVTGITSIGRDNPTKAQRDRAHTLLCTLQGDRSLFLQSPFLQNIFFRDVVMWPDDWDPVPTNSAPPARNLDLAEKHMNPSQMTAIVSMLSPSPEHRLVLIQGPPGTGKTSVIANFVQAASNEQLRGIWLVAQSNVAVKNIAEKLIAYGYHAFRLLVSKDFRHEWHDHLYLKIESYIIQSDEFSQYMGNRMKGVEVMLCTLSMLSNAYITKKFTPTVPLATLVVDEASQIEVGDYVPVLDRFSSLRKICFIGDNKQLPPFGQEDIEDLQSIFEVDHLQNNTIFLDTQYRMPPQMGDFISEAVYNNQLHSNPHHPVGGHASTCIFINVEGEEKFFNKSFQNIKEADAVLLLAAQIQERGWSYRIVMPYEAQRGLVEERMKGEGLQWEDKCFNVDSFQGNEDDYIIISLVRSSELGFLKSLRRTNVMLTRFRRKMYIVANKGFLLKAGSESLVGRLAQHVGDTAWISMQELNKGII